MDKVVTRFAPSPTGFLHIGGARTALFNYLFSKNQDGRFYLRIEDTDMQRSTAKATRAIISGLNWLGIKFDPFSPEEEIVYQSKRFNAYRDLIQVLLQEGKAYKCFMTPEEISQQKQEAINQGKSFVLRSSWRDVSSKDLSMNNDKPYVIRFKVDDKKTSVIYDQVHGKLSFDNTTIEDFALSRSNMEPLYNLSAVCDDHYMGITHIIRGDDHITNAIRQYLIYQAMDWPVPIMIHIPLIHGPDGSKLSKRHGAMSVEEYRDLGYLPESLNSYLMRLGWSYESDEIISTEQAIKLFSIENLGKSAARLDFDKMKNVNAFYIKQLDSSTLTTLIEENWNISLENEDKQKIEMAMASLKARAKLTTELSNMAKIYVDRFQIEFTEEAKKTLKETDPQIISSAVNLIQELKNLNQISLQDEFKKLASNMSLKLGDLMKPIRCLLTGSTSSPSVFEIIEIIGRDSSIKRLKIFEANNK